MSRFHALALLVLSSSCVKHVAVPSTEVNEVPAGMIDVNVVSGDDRPWQVRVDGAALCTTPCVQRVETTQSLELLPPSGSMLVLHDLGIEAIQARRAIVVPEGLRNGQRATGITFTTLGGMGVVTGIALTAAGCSRIETRAGMCTAGLITGGVSTAVTAFALWLLLDALPKVHVLPVGR